ncbi:hypothetical protein ACVWXQ_000397 [Bradyrhizobium sp. S3.14.4]
MRVEMKNLLLATVSLVALDAMAPAFGADLAAQPVQPLYNIAPQPVAAANLRLERLLSRYERWLGL